ncbi:hypothetical protein FRB93_003035 [Tulasnella sp. JGI-2019a]|nr:hypothetical protein FRB93_003035 [Tulasnella sp. JGI-2019a]
MHSIPYKPNPEASNHHPLQLTEQTLPESIDTSAWNVLLNKYAHKITRLFLDRALRGSSIRLLATLLGKSPCSVLCPNLKSLRLVMGQYSERLYAMAIPILCGSSVVSVEMRGLRRSNRRNPVPVAEHLGIALKTCGSQIRRFTLGSRTSHNTFTPDFSLFNHLTEVSLRNLSRGGWQKLAEDCPQLLEVSVIETLWKPRRLESIGDPTKPINFPLLRKLEISSISLVHGILLESNMPALESLIVHRPVEDVNGTITRQLVQRSRLLQEVEWCVKQSHGVGSIIRALASLCHLRKLKITGGTSEWDMADGDMDILARSVSNLQSISITLKQTLGYGKDKIPLTHTSLLSFVQHCRQLTSIELSLDLSHVDDCREKSASFPSSTTVTSLILREIMLPSKIGDGDPHGTSEVDVVDRVVTFLAGCCPEARRFEVYELDEFQGVMEALSVTRTCIEEGFRKYLDDVSHRKSVNNALHT